MAFPTRALVIGIATGLAMMWMLSVPSLVSLVLGVLTFMGMGGLQYTTMVIKFLPRDLW